MRLMLWVGDEGPTDLDLKDGDIWAVKDNDWVPGTEELKKWFVIELEEYGGTQGELIEPEYTVGATPDATVIRHARKYAVNYWEKLIPEEIAAVRDKTVSVPIMSGRFGLFDINRK